MFSLQLYQIDIAVFDCFSKRLLPWIYG